MDLEKKYKTRGSHTELYEKIKSDDKNDKRLSLIYEYDIKNKKLLVKEPYKGGDNYILWGYLLIYGNRSSIDRNNVKYHYEEIRIFDIRKGKCIYQCFQEKDNERVPYDDIEKNRENKYHWHIGHPKLFKFEDIKKVNIVKASDCEKIKDKLYKESIKDSGTRKNIIKKENSSIDKIDKIKIEYEKIKSYDEQQDYLDKLSDNEIIELAKRSGSDKPLRKIVSTKQFNTDNRIFKAALLIANGICQLCKHDAPFLKKDGSPYLEVHHIISRAKGGADRLSNCVALCPNCHRKMHIVEDEKDKKKLSKIASKYEKINIKKL